MSEDVKNNRGASNDERRMMSGSEIVAQSLVRNGVSVVFAYPGAVTMPLHQTLLNYRDRIRVILPRHEQGGGFEAQGYARASGKTGVCMATSGPGATNLITSIADAKLDSIPLVVITGQVNTTTIGSDGFQETPMTEVCRSITKHHYLVTDIKDLARTMKEAFFVASTGRPGPVLVDLPKDILVGSCFPDFEVEMNLPGYSGEKIQPLVMDLDETISAVQAARRPVLFAGGGVALANAAEEMTRFAELTNMPVTTSLTGLATFPGNHRQSLGMLGMHGTVYANRAVHDCDLLLACGVRFSDRVTGKLSEFARNARIIHVDIDPSEFNKVRRADRTIKADLKLFFRDLLKKMEGTNANDLSEWYSKIEGWKKDYPLQYDKSSPYILPEHALSELCRLSQDRNVIITTGVGQHQMWTAQFYRFSKPRTWISSCGLGTMGFGLPAAIGAKTACPEAIVVDIDGDGSFQMNIQEMAVCHTEKIPVKVMLMNNQHLGMVMQWEDRFHSGHRGNTYLGSIDDPEMFGKGDGISPRVRYPNYPGIAESYGWRARSISKKEELDSAIVEMLDAAEPFLLEVNVPYREHVLPMMPPGGTIETILLNQPK